jgi:hypothetical protein
MFSLALALTFGGKEVILDAFLPFCPLQKGLKRAAFVPRGGEEQRLLSKYRRRCLDCVFFPPASWGGYEAGSVYPSGGRNYCLVVAIAGMGWRMRTAARLTRLRPVGWRTYFFLNLVAHFLVQIG